jgi:hypothetical protein
MWNSFKADIHSITIPIFQNNGQLIDNTSSSPIIPLKAIYFPGENIHQKNLKQILKAVNTFPELDITIQDTYNKFRFLMPYLNGHIKLSANKITDFDTFQLFIGSGSIITKGLASSKLSLVIGDKGLGGLVNLSNYEILKKYNFSGRPGGTMHEYIPHKLLSSVFNEVISLKDISFVKQLRKYVMRDYSANYFFQQIQQVIRETIRLSRTIKDMNRISNLCPVVGDNFLIKKSGCTIRGNISTHLSGIDKETLELVKKCNGKETMAKVLKQEGYSNKDLSVFVENVMELWNNKLVTFH